MMELQYKLKSSISSNILKIIEIYNKIDSGQLSPSPSFQRKLVWKKQHKYEFIRTILMNFPFPEVYIASSELDVNTLQTKEVVVDGQQRLTTIVDYIKGTGDFDSQCKVTPFAKLDLESKREFLNYPVSVKDLKDIGDERIKVIFQRINSTDYDLNTNEKLNAQYGDSEFAIFAKQLVDLEFNVDDLITDILINEGDRNFIYNFFHLNKIFKENDIKRMFDSQYIMLISATVLEGAYFGRSGKINYYLERFNSEFTNYGQVLEKILEVLKVINDLGFSVDSYWFNKANLFTLIIELSKVNLENIDVNEFERLLLELEKKVTVYFEEDEMSDLISADEQKYFEFARQGSHELQARNHRGHVIANILNECKLETDMAPVRNLLDEEGVDYVVIIPTTTSLAKSIMDATTSVRDFLYKKGIHNYEIQEKGVANKVVKNAFYFWESKKIPLKVSMYRSNGRGDFRIWFSDLSNFAKANDKIGISYEEDELRIYNLTKV